jgi:hypothetical protein
MLVFVLAAIVLIGISVLMVETSTRSENENLQSTQSSDATTSIVASSVTSSLHHSTSEITTAKSSSALFSSSAQLYPSYSPPDHDTINLTNPCQWWCNANAYDILILNYSAQFGVPDPMLIKSQIALESGFNSSAMSILKNQICGGGADYGLMQINPNCNNVTTSQLFNATYNLYWGIRLWANDYLYLREKWGSNCNTSTLLAGTLELYNGGSDSIGNTCGSFLLGLKYTILVEHYYFPFCTDANYEPMMQVDTSPK